MGDLHIHNPLQGMWIPLQVLLVGIALLLIVMPAIGASLSGFIVFIITLILIVGAIVAILIKLGIGSLLENIFSQY